MKKTIFILAVSLSVLIMAQQRNPPVQKTTLSTQVIESQVQQKINSEVNVLRKEILDNRERMLSNEHKIGNLFISKLGTQGFLISLLGFFGLGYYLREFLKRKINKNVTALEQECETSVKKVKEIENDTILRIQNTEVENADLRKKSKILIISETSTPVNDTIEHLFEKKSAKINFNYTHIRIKELSFKQVEIALAYEGNILPSDFDMMILDNCDAENRYWKGDHFKTHIVNFTKEFLTRKVGVLFFSNDQRFPSRDLVFRNIPNRYLLDYVNSHAHLYANAMNVLKLKNLLG